MQETTNGSPLQVATSPLDHLHGERKSGFVTVSLEEVNQLYTLADTANIDFERDIAEPGAFPYTRAIHTSGYRGKLWTMRQFASSGTPEETISRSKHLLQEA